MTKIIQTKDFLLSQTLECGQCFHFNKIAEEEYLISAKGKLLHASQEGNNLILHNIEDTDADMWLRYFDLDRDYAAIKDMLLTTDKLLAPSIEAMWGVRILRQDFFETLISFIISQNQQIPRIKQIVANLSKAAGTELADGMYAFPTAEAILELGVDGVRECKAGFRSPYIIDACEKYVSGVISEQALRDMSYEECIETLKQIKGVGDKVANCVALFALEKRSAFPIDVWIKRIMESIYFKKETPIKDIAKLASERFGEYGGYAQQYLFYYGRELTVGEKVSKTEKKKENTRKQEKI